MSHITGPVKRKRLKEKNNEEKIISELLKKHNKGKKVAKKSTSRKKRKDYSEMIAILGDMYDQESVIRNPSNWKSSSYNLNRQVISFIKWIYEIYDPPVFMYDIFLSKHKNYPWPADFARIFKWFIIIAQGKSFTKNSSDLMTKKESHLFLCGRDDLDVFENITLAKARAAGAREWLCSLLVQRCTTRSLRVNNKFEEIIRFFPRFQSEIDRDNFYDVMDYLDEVYRDDYSLKGRTFSSLIKASNTWHRQSHLRKLGALNLSLELSDIQDWSWTDKESKCIWTVKQIKTSKELYREGSKMRHCVASYATRCNRGSSFIFSLEENDGINLPAKRLTIELDRQHTVVQVRGKHNARPTGRPKLIFEKWANSNGVKYTNWIL